MFIFSLDPNTPSHENIDIPETSAGGGFPGTPPILSLIDAHLPRMGPAVQAQQPAWVLGNELVRFPQSSAGSITAEPLPVPNDPGVAPELQYDGTVPGYSQYVQLDDRGLILFFIVDGNVYDRNGYLISAAFPDVPGLTFNDPRTDGLLFIGRGEVTAVPVPGRCGVWYIFHSRSLPHIDAYQQLDFAVLDMTQPSHVFPNSGRTGLLFDAADLALNGFQEMGTYGHTPFSMTSHGEIPDVPGWEGGAKNGALQFKAIHEPVTGRSLLLAHNGHMFAKYELLHDRIVPLGYHEISTTQGWGLRAPGEIEAHAIGSIIRVAFAYTRAAYPPEGGQWLHYVHVAELDASSPDLPLNTVGQSIFLDQIAHSPLLEDVLGGELWFPAIGGLEFSDEGDRLYWVKPYGPTTAPSGIRNMIGAIDLLTQQVIGLDDTGLEAYNFSKMERNVGPDGTGSAIYLSGTQANGTAVLGCILEGAGGTTDAWIDLGQVTLTNSPCMDESLNQLAGTRDLYHLLQKQPGGDPGPTILTSEICCETLMLMTGFSSYVAPTGFHTWTDDDNPFMDLQEVRVTGTFTVPTGSHITANDMLFRFAADAELVIEPGGSFTAHNCVFTAACDAPWKGIRVHGTTSNNTQSVQFQGRLTLTNSSTVEHAEVGVWAATVLPNGSIDEEGYGGVVRMLNSTIKDCARGVKVENYHRMFNGIRYPNLSYFSNSEFITTADWMHESTPGAQLFLFEVDQVSVTSCAFRHDNHEAVHPRDRGYGLVALMATFRCLGSGDPDNVFAHLTGGLVSSSPDPGGSFKVDGMRFHENWMGLVDLGSRGARITNNVFRTLALPAQDPEVEASHGMLLYSSEGYTIERNTVVDPQQNVLGVGITFMADAFQNNEIYENDFVNTVVGCLVDGVQRSPFFSPEVAPGLQMRCNVFEENTTAQLIVQDSYIQLDQGLGGNVQTLANNAFNSDPSCGSSGPGPAWHPFVWAPIDYDLFVNYHFYDNAMSPEQRPSCIEDAVGTPLSFVGDLYYDLYFYDEPIAFNRAVHCASGVLDVEGAGGGGGVGGLVNDYSTKTAQLASAWNTYKGEVDKNEREDLVAAINQQPWLPSYALRDMLMTHYPLSDSVMITMLKRLEPMDPWHLTQVLIQNSRLSPMVTQYIEQEEPLPPYFYDLLMQYQSEEGVRRIMEMEIVLRQQEKSFAMRRLLDAYSTDSTLTNLTDSILYVLDADSLGDGLRSTYLHHLAHHEYAAAAALQPALAGSSWMEDLGTFGAIQASVQGQWTATTTADREEFLSMALQHSPSAGAQAWAVLLAIGELDSIPMPGLPPSYKRSVPFTRSGRYGSGNMPTIGVLPNPASDRIAFTYADGLDEGTLEVFDAQGRMVRSLSLSGRRGLIEASVGDLSDGLYTVRIMLDGIQAGSAKFSVVR